jgi:hypothetical protein
MFQLRTYEGYGSSVRLSGPSCGYRFPPATVSVTPEIAFSIQNCVPLGRANAWATLPSFCELAFLTSHFSSSVPRNRSSVCLSSSDRQINEEPHLLQKPRKRRGDDSNSVYDSCDSSGGTNCAGGTTKNCAINEAVHFRHIVPRVR